MQKIVEVDMDRKHESSGERRMDRKHESSGEKQRLERDNLKRMSNELKEKARQLREQAEDWRNHKAS